MELSLNRAKSVVGTENYRFSMCLLFANKQMSHSYSKLKKLAKKFNVTVEKQEKIEAMMLVKCNSTLPVNVTKKVQY